MDNVTALLDYWYIAPLLFGAVLWTIFRLVSIRQEKRMILDEMLGDNDLSSSGKFLDGKGVMGGRASSLNGVDRLIAAYVPTMSRVSKDLYAAKMEIPLFIYLGFVLICGASLGYVLELSFVPLFMKIAVSIVIFHLFVSKIVLDFFAERRRMAIKIGIPPAVDSLLRITRIGNSMERAIGLVAHEMTGPLSDELKTVDRMVNLGSSVEDSLRLVANDLDIPEFNFMVAAYAIKQQTGGNLGVALEALSENVRGQIALARKVQSLMSEGKASAIFVSLLPPAIFLYFYLLSPSYIEPLLTTDHGQMLLSIAVLWQSLGVFGMILITRIKV